MSTPSTLTETQFLALPVSTRRTELVDGEVIVSPAPNNLHQFIVARLHLQLAHWAQAHPPAFVGLSPFDVRIAPGRIVQPDLFVLLGGPPDPHELYRGVPDLTIEVLSSKPRNDRERKRRIYQDAGVREYWMLDPTTQTVDVVVDEQLTSHTDSFTSVIATDLTVDVRALFVDVR